jgi:hypothetical protein
MRRYEKHPLETAIPQPKVTRLLIVYLAMVEAGFVKTRV